MGDPHRRTGVQHRRGPRPLLRSCYTTSLAVAASLGARSVAYPLISSGEYRWPKDDAVAQALTALHAEPTTVEVVRLVLFDEQTRQDAERVYQASDYGR